MAGVACVSLVVVTIPTPMPFSFAISATVGKEFVNDSAQLPRLTDGLTAMTPARVFTPEWMAVARKGKGARAEPQGGPDYGIERPAGRGPFSRS